jgi:hypothetical protein
LASENEEIKKSITSFVSVEELQKRIFVVNDEINKKLEVRPTKDWVHRVLSIIDSRIEKCEETVTQFNLKLFQI